MPRVKLTANFVERAKVEPGKQRSIYWDEGFRTFGLMVSNTGHKSYVYQYRDRTTRQQSRVTFLFDLGLKKAKAAAEEARMRVQLGGKPLDEIGAAKASRKAETLKAISEEYLAHKQGGAGLRSKKQVKSVLDRLVYPKLGSRPINDIKRSEIIRMLDGISEEQGPVAADYTLAIVRKIMNWHAIRSDDFRSLIVRGMSHTKPKERARDRVLTDDELRAIWKAAGESTGPFGPMLRFILLTACRRTEAASMRRSEVVGTDWIIPASRYKTKTETVLPLSQAAQAVLQALPRKVDYFFTTGKKPISGFSKFKSSFDKACGVTDWTIHDLRRTARSLMSRAGVPSDHAERALGHVITGVRGTYDRHAYHAEKKQAFEALAAQIDRILDPQDNVVPMRSEVPA
jgi:integrase